MNLAFGYYIQCNSKFARVKSSSIHLVCFVQFDSVSSAFISVPHFSDSHCWSLALSQLRPALITFFVIQSKSTSNSIRAVHQSAPGRTSSEQSNIEWRNRSHTTIASANFPIMPRPRPFPLSTPFNLRTNNWNFKPIWFFNDNNKKESEIRVSISMRFQLGVWLFPRIDYLRRKHRYWSVSFKFHIWSISN